MKDQVKGPVCEYKDQLELNASLAYWKEKLFLTDWIIKAKVVPQAEMEQSDCAGENLLNFETKFADIKIIPASDYIVNGMKFCQEKILVHELLHCKYNFMSLPNDSYEWNFLDVMDHQKLEEMAKSLIMVKYNIPFSWFAED